MQYLMPQCCASLGRGSLRSWLDSLGLDLVLHFWWPELDPAHPADCTKPERYVLQLLGDKGFLAIGPDGQSLVVVPDAAAAHLFHAHDAAVRAARELNAEGRGPVDVVKIELGLG